MNKKKTKFFFLSILLIVLLFSHTPTWNIFLHVIGLLLSITFFKNKRKNRRAILYTFFSILPFILIDVVRMLLINTSGVKQEIGFAMQRDIGVYDISTIWNNLIDTTHLYLAGQIGNPLTLLLVLYCLYSTKLKEENTKFFIFFFSLFALYLLFADKVIQARFYYEIPLQIPAAIALTALKERIGN